jgi:hypothetical protein
LIILIVLGEQYSYEAPHYTAFSNLLSLHSSSAQIISSATCSQTLSVCVPPLMSETSFTPIQNHRQNYSFVFSNFYVFTQRTRRQKVLGWMVASKIGRASCRERVFLSV